MAPKPSIETPPGVAALDALAGQLLLRAGVRIGVAHTAAEFEAVHRVRLPDGLERDVHDDHALQLAAWRGTKLVGTMRLVLPVPFRRLPTEDAFDLRVEPHGEVVDLGRLLVGPGFRGDPSQRAWGGLFALAWQETRIRGYNVIAGVASVRLLERYRLLGVNVEILGPARTFWGAERHPVRIHPAAGEPPDWF